MFQVRVHKIPCGLYSKTWWVSRLLYQTLTFSLKSSTSLSHAISGLITTCLLLSLLSLDLIGHDLTKLTVFTSILHLSNAQYVTFS